MHLMQRSSVWIMTCFACGLTVGGELVAGPPAESHRHAPVVLSQQIELLDEGGLSASFPPEPVVKTSPAETQSSLRNLFPVVRHLWGGDKTPAAEPPRQMTFRESTPVPGIVRVSLNGQESTPPGPPELTPLPDLIPPASSGEIDRSEFEAAGCAELAGEIAPVQPRTPRKWSVVRLPALQRLFAR